MKKHKRIDPDCPWCGRKFLGQGGVFLVKDRPRPDDFSLCTECRNVSVFNADGTLRKATDSEMFELMMDERASSVIGQGGI